MNKKLIVNTNVAETRIALTENDRLAEYYVERENRRSIVGNIYMGKVSRVLPGMQSAFINIGGDRSAFLFGGDILSKSNGELQLNKDYNHQVEKQRVPIEKVLSLGQQILIQVAKEPLGTKGPRVTMLIAIPGRYLVLMPEFSNIGISRRITDEEKRTHLYEIIENIKPDKMGVIVRTAAADVDKESLIRDLDFLSQVWHNITEKRKTSKAPSLLYQEPDIILKTTRDLYSEDVSEIIVDSKQSLNQLQHFLVDTIPGSKEKLKLYEGKNPIFDEYGLEICIAAAVTKKVWLPSGGYMVVERTEALSTFDVNTGKFVGTKNARETLLKTNLEAAREIVFQLRLRNIGGIIIIDFIDMNSLEDRSIVYTTLLESLKSDKARTNVLPISELGLVEMTRKRTRESLDRILTLECPCCRGHGRLLSPESLAYDMIRDIQRYAVRSHKKEIIVRVRNDVYEWIMEEDYQIYENLCAKLNLGIQFQLVEFNRTLLKSAPYEVLDEA